MTREEAITAIKTWIGCMHKTYNNNEFAMEFVNGAETLMKEALKQPEIIYCKDCKNFMEYSDEYKQTEKADGDCFNLKINTDNPRLIKKKFYDYCSYAERKDD